MEEEAVIELKVAIAVLTTRVENLTEAMNKFEKRIEKADSEKNLNIVEWFRDNFVVLIVGGVLIAHTFGLI